MIEFFRRNGEQLIYFMLTGVVGWLGIILSNQLKKYIVQQKNILNRMEDYQATVDDFKETQLILLNDRYFQACRYYIKQGHISMRELKNLQLLYEKYHNNGGNGFGTTMLERCYKLKLDDTEE